MTLPEATNGEEAVLLPPELPAEIAKVLQEEHTESAPVQLAEVDFLRYQLGAKEVEKQVLLAEMYLRELQRAQADKNKAMHVAALFDRELEKKYSISMATHTVTADGFIVPRSMLRQADR